MACHRFGLDRSDRGIRAPTSASTHPPDPKRRGAHTLQKKCFSVEKLAHLRNPPDLLPKNPPARSGRGPTDSRVIKRLLFISLLSLSATFSVAAEAPVWKTENPSAANEGHLVLNWQPVPGANNYQLEDGENTPRYTGPDLAFFASGLSEGTHSFRVRADDGPWSDPLEVTVTYPSSTKVITLLVIGGIVFLLTVLTVLRGFFRQQTSGDPSP